MAQVAAVKQGVTQEDAKLKWNNPTLYRFNEWADERIAELQSDGYVDFERGQILALTEAKEMLAGIMRENR